MTRSRVPTATYRLQLTADQTFDDAIRLVGPLSRSGISHLYLSPILTARPGSRHFYDVADHRYVDPVLGGDQGLRRLAEAAHEVGMGLIGDVVPHHMGVGPWNPVWDALLRQGRSSDAARHVDVDWETALPGARDKVIMPVLDGPYGDELAAGRLQLAETAAGVRVTYGELSFPLNAETQEAAERSGVDRLVGRPDEPRSWTRMHSLLEQQHYRLVSRRAGRRLVNYRRFHDIDELAAVRVEEPTVFEASHRVMIDLVADGTLDGLRIDHVDGLADPAEYVRLLRDAVGPDAWLVVERISSTRDPLPSDWPADGTTGYELLRTSLGLQVDPQGLRHLTVLAASHGGVVDARQSWQIRMAELDRRLGPDLRRLVQVAWAACQDEMAVRDVDYRTMLEAISRVLVALPVVRTYVDPKDGSTTEHDRDVAERAVDAARRSDGSGAVPEPLWRWLTALLQGEVRWTGQATEAVTRLQQLSAPLHAVAVEQRIFFQQAAMPAACEIGCDPGDVAVTVAEAHEAIAAMPPRGLRTTATHDTVHGEDVRMRMAALAGMAGPWTTTADQVLTSTAPPDPALGLRILAAVTAVWPITDDGTTPLTEVLDAPELVDRLVDYAVACARGQGVITSRTEHDEDAEGQLAGWVRSLLDPTGAVAPMLRPIAVRAAEVGMAASLSQVLLRTTVPGIPDTYQGTERWDDSLLAPDNRREVDHDVWIAAADRWQDGSPDAADLWARRRDGEVKQWVLQRALQLRAAHPGTFRTGGHVPLAATGRWAAHVMAFARTDDDGRTAIVICPRLLGRVTDGGRFPPVGRIWADTEVELPADGRGGPDVADGASWTDVLSGHTVPAGAAVVLADLLADLPVALLVRQPA